MDIADINEALRAKIEKVKLLILDCDGVLTDGSIIYSEHGGETKAFNVRDGHGIKLLKRVGIECAIITARSSEVLKRRAEELGIVHLYQKELDKAAAYNKILKECKLEPDETLYMGDDIIDIPVFTRVGVGVAVADAVEEVIELADYVTVKCGGRGAVREVAEIIMKIQGHWDSVMAKYLD